MKIKLFDTLGTAGVPWPAIAVCRLMPRLQVGPGSEALATCTRSSGTCLNLVRPRLLVHKRMWLHVEATL